MAITQKVSNRIAAALKRFQPILASARARDVNESDTVVIVTDLLQEVFGYDKYAEITSEHAIRSTFCDLAIKGPDGKPVLLLEAKAIGVELKDIHVKQAIDYAANQGTEWVVLTNGVIWKIFKVVFAKPIDMELVLELDLEKINPKSDDDLERVWLLSKEGWAKGGLGDYYTQRRALSRFVIGAVVTSEPILDVVRRELKKISPGVRISNEEILHVLEHEVIKRDVLEGDKHAEARKLVSRTVTRSLRAKGRSAESATGTAEQTAAPAVESTDAKHAGEAMA